jgi:plastocyanin
LRTGREGLFVNRIAAFASTLAAFLLILALMAWMTAQVAEHPGVPRAVGELPPWFAGGPIAGRGDGRPVAAPAPTGAQPREAHAPSQSAESAVADADFVQVAGGKIEIALTEYEMKPDKIRVGPGTVTFVLRNEGRFAHNFHVEGPGVDAHAEKFSPGRTIRLEVALQEGEYKLSCPLSNHDQRGMHGTLIAAALPAGK